MGAPESLPEGTQKIPRKRPRNRPGIRPGKHTGKRPGRQLKSTSQDDLEGVAAQQGWLGKRAAKNHTKHPCDTPKQMFVVRGRWANQGCYFSPETFPHNT